MKSIFTASLVAVSLSMLAGCVADVTDSGDTVVADTAQESQALQAGGTLACTVVDPGFVDTIAVVCDPLGHCSLSITPPDAPSATSYPLTVLSARRGIVIMSSGALGMKVVMSVTGSTPTAADVYSTTTGLLANCY